MLTRDFIRSEGGDVISIWHLLEELSVKFGDRFPVSPDAYEVLDLVETLWADPHIGHPMRGSIEFAWAERRVVDRALPPEFVAMLCDRLLARPQGVHHTRLERNIPCQEHQW